MSLYIAEYLLTSHTLISSLFYKYNRYYIYREYNNSQINILINIRKKTERHPRITPSSRRKTYRKIANNLTHNIYINSLLEIYFCIIVAALKELLHLFLTWLTWIRTCTCILNSISSYF